MKTYIRNNNVYTLDDVKQALRTDDRAAMRGLLLIYAAQTQDEKEAATTAHNNGVGFTGVDAQFLTSLAKQCLKRRTLSRKQLDVLHVKMPKYATQIFNYMRDTQHAQYVNEQIQNSQTI